jgi:hypothetical protein
MPALLTTMSSPPKCAAISLTTALTSSRLATSNVQGFCGSAAGEDLGSNRLRAFRAKIGDRDLGAFSREHPRRGAAHATGRTGDENGQSLHRPAFCLKSDMNYSLELSCDLQD